MQDTIEEIARKSRKGKSITNQKIEIGQTYVERPHLIAAITTGDEETNDKLCHFKCFKKVKRILSRLHQRRKKFEV